MIGILLLVKCLLAMPLAGQQVTWRAAPAWNVDAGGGFALSSLNFLPGTFAPAVRWDPGWLLSARFSRYDVHRIGGIVEVQAGSRHCTLLLGTTPTVDACEFRFVEVPVLARFDLLRRKTKTRPPFITAGVGLGRGFKGTSTIHGQSSTVAGGTYLDAVVGGGLEVHRLSIEPTFSQGLTVFKPATTSLGERRIRSFAVLFFYRVK